MRRPLIMFLDNLYFTRCEEIINIINSSKTKKAVGPEDISNLILKYSTTKTIAYVNGPFNSMLTISYFPNRWKLAEVIFISKLKKPLNFIKDYLPISLLSCVGKVAEAVIETFNIKIRL
jgi:hypothetical protein